MVVGGGTEAGAIDPTNGLVRPTGKDKPAQGAQGSSNANGEFWPQELSVEATQDGFNEEASESRGNQKGKGKGKLKKKGKPREKSTFLPAERNETNSPYNRPPGPYTCKVNLKQEVLVPEEARRYSREGNTEHLGGTLKKMDKELNRSNPYTADVGSSVTGTDPLLLSSTLCGVGL